VSDLLTRSKGFFSFIQRNFVFSVLIDCALANLIAVGKIVTAEIFVFSRAIEDAVDMVLMRSRGEAELARMMTEITKLQELVTIWENSRSRALLRCDTAPPDKKRLVLRNLDYTRGTAAVRADHVELTRGVYALTGSNGSGKSTLFRVLMSCDSNEKSIDLPPSINLLTPAEPLAEKDDIRRLDSCEAVEDAGEEIVVDECESDLVPNRELVEAESSTAVIPKLSITMPSSQVIEISQTFYWPLFSKPIDWIFQDHVSEHGDGFELEKRLRRVAEELQSLQFFQPVLAKDEDDVEDIEGTIEATMRRIMDELQEEKEDWFSDLSGGQKSKVELVRKVFLLERCPDVLLIDETMAPLDPDSKALVMEKLKKFCNESIIIVIYHTDVGRDTDAGPDAKSVACIPSNDFFDKNIHLEKGFLLVKDTC
jgi:energy-coupling factor transporter ATP-binding protein EcfA2